MGDPFDCPHGMGKATACVECMNDGPVVPLRQERIVADFWMTHAQYASLCKKCDGQITEGDAIGKLTDFGWCCTKCAKEPQS